jgi:N-sulfoglucosamine sulfohydrolase
MNPFRICFRILPLLALFPVVGRGAEAGPPNILFLLSDDHSMPYIGLYGAPALRTPALDRLAREGLRADRAFTTAPQCVPSRASLLTGRSPVAARMVRFTAPLPRDVSSLPELLRGGANYFTGVAGRYYHLDGPEVGLRPAPVNAAAIERHDLRDFARRLDYVQPPGKMEDFGGKLAAFLDRAPANRPWFFWLNFSDPHHVWTHRGPRGAIDPAAVRVPAYLPDLPGVRGDLARHLAEIENLDRDVGEVLAELERRGLVQNTLVVFMGDNGMAFPHGKGYLHDPGLHVPLFVRWPGVVRPERVSDALLSGEDLAPTLLEAAGVAVPREMTGVSFLPLLRDQAFPRRREYIFAERGPHGSDGRMQPDVAAPVFDLSRCVRTDRYKLIYNCTPHGAVAPVDSADQPGWQEMKAAHAAGTLEERFVRAYFPRTRPTYELYDLQADPVEMVNLAGRAEYAGIEKQLKEALSDKMVQDSDFLPLPLN